MTPRFRFRFSLVFSLGFLLTCPTRALSKAAASCTAAAQGLNGVKTSEFVSNVANCLESSKEAYSEFQGVIKQLPEVIDKLLPVARSQGLVLLYFYFFYNSYILYDEVKTLEVNLKMYRNKFAALEKEMKPYRDFIDTELIPQWKAGNTANLEKIVDKLLEKIARSNAVLQELTQAIGDDIKRGGSNQKWSGFLVVASVGGLAVCVGSLVVRPTPNVATPPSSGVVGDASFIWMTLPICAAAIGTAGYSWPSYISVNDTLPKLERLEKAVTTMSEEITRYQSELDLAKIRRDLYT